MDIGDAISQEYVSFEPSTPVSKLRGAFDRDAETHVIVVEGTEGFEGVVSQKELLASHHTPEEKTRSVTRNPPRVTPTEDVRETARLMVESELKLLPVFDGDRFVGVVTDRDLLALVEPNLEVLDVADVVTRDLVSVGPKSGLGEVIHVLRENGISRVPVVDETGPLGIISLHDLVGFTVREMDRNQGGAPPGFDNHGGSGSHAGYRTHQGFGERAGDSARMLDMPARDVMSTPVEAATYDERLDEAVDRLLKNGYSSLLVESPDDDQPLGIVTTTDVLRALTVTEDEHVDVQIFGVDLMDDLDRTTVAERIEEIDHKYAEMDILEANVVFQRHREQTRGRHLVLATVRLFTDEGRFSGSGEEYGAKAAFDRAADVAEENALEDKERSQVWRKREANRERSRKMLGWWLGD